MTINIGPVAPDWDGLLRNLRRDGTPERVYYFEHGVADTIIAALDARFAISDTTLPADERGIAAMRAMAVHRFLGHELFRVFPPGARMAVPTDGPWVNEARGPVASWEEMEAYPWPRAEEADLSILDTYERRLPEEMRVFHVLSLWELVRDLFGFEAFCYALYEDPALVETVFARVGGFVEAIIAALCDYRCVGAIYLADDLGYKTSLMIAPEAVRRFILPWHRRLAALTHAHGKLFFLHSCGQMYALMDEYIGTVRIDAKHSFEENVLPVTEVKRRYGDRVSLLGGVDVDLLARGDEASIRAKTRDILATCQPGGGYCLGSGNWVTDYIPLDHYLIMLDEARRWEKCAE